MKKTISALILAATICASAHADNKVTFQTHGVIFNVENGDPNNEGINLYTEGRLFEYFDLFRNPKSTVQEITKKLNGLVERRKTAGCAETTIDLDVLHKFIFLAANDKINELESKIPLVLPDMNCEDGQLE